MNGFSEIKITKNFQFLDCNSKKKVEDCDQSNLVFYGDFKIFWK